MSEQIANSARIFISYSRKDGEEFATNLRLRLERDYSDLTLWQDRAQMEGGVGWWQQIEEALRHVEFLVLVATPEAMNSKIVAKEWRTARQQGVCIYPVQVPGLPLDFDVLPRWMRDVHFYDLNYEWETFIGHLRQKCTETRVPFMVPDIPDHFVERPTEFDTLIGSLLDREQSNPIAITTALHGAGGFGKTTLAAAVCHNENVITAFDDGILWVTLGEKPDVVGGLTKLYAALTGERVSFVDVEDATKVLVDALANKDCLIVIDDVWNTADLRPFLRGGIGCARLITTRISQIAIEAKATYIEVDEMTSNQAVDLLITNLDPLIEREPFRQMATRLGEWPLLLELANAFLRECIMFGDMPETALELLDESLDEEGITTINTEEADERRRGAAGALAASLRMLDKTEQARLFELAIFPEDTAIPITTVQQLWGEQLFSGKVQVRTRRLLQRLAGLAFCRLDLESGTLRIHDVIRQSLSARLGDVSSIHKRLLDAWGSLHVLPDMYAWQYVAYHLIGADRGTELRTLLLNYNWLCAKLKATDSASLIRDYDYFSPGDEVLRLVQGAIRLSAHKLAIDKDALAGQLYGRLVAAKQEDIRALLEMIGKTKRAWLRPLHPTLIPPGGPLLRILEGHTDEVYALAVLPADETSPMRIVSSGGGHSNNIYTLRIWEADTGKCVKVLQGSTPITALAVLPATEYSPAQIVSGGSDHIVRIWNTQTWEWVQELKGHTSRVSAIAILPGNETDPTRIVSGGDNTVRVWDVDTGNCVQVLEGHTGNVEALAILPASEHNPAWIISGSQDYDGEDNTIRVWNVAGNCVRLIEGHTGSVEALEVLPADEFGPARIVSGSGDYSDENDFALRVWDLTTGECLQVWAGHTGPVETLALLPGDENKPMQLISGGHDNTVRIWDVATGECVQVFTGHISWIHAVAVLTANDQRLAQVVSAGNDATVRIWDVGGRAGLSMLTGHTDPTTDVKVLPKDEHNLVRVISAGHDNTVRIWNATTGRCMQALKGHMDGVLAVAVLPANDHRSDQIVSGGQDKTVRIWDTMTGKCLQVLKGHTESVAAVTVQSADDYGLTRVVSGSLDDTIRIWDTTNWECVKVLRGHLLWVQALTVVPAGDNTPPRLISGGADNTVRVWDAVAGKLLSVLSGHTNRVTGVAALIYPDSRWWVVSTAMDRTLRVWNPITGDCEAVFYADAEMRCCDVSSDGLIVAGDNAGMVHFLRYTV